MKLRYVCVALSVALAGCADNEGSEPPNFFEVSTENTSLTGGKFVDSENTLLENLPTSGSATYEGGMVLGLVLGSSAQDLTDTVAGRLQLNANFQDSTISGSVTDFVDANNQSKPGALRVGNGIIEDLGLGDASLSADAIGEVTLGDTNYELNAFMTGDFKGPTGALIFGGAGGLGRSEDGDTVNIEGYFAAEVQ